MEVMNSFELVFNTIEDEIIIDREYYNMKEEQCKWFPLILNVCSHPLSLLVVYAHDHMLHRTGLLTEVQVRGSFATSDLCLCPQPSSMKHVIMYMLPLCAHTEGTCTKVTIDVCSSGLPLGLIFVK